ncbi:MAG: type V CRISPR-associated protein Cas4 [Patescibacteria group bacterium]
MEQYIQISKLNDFIFCPYSLYFHSIYENYEKKVFQRSVQTVGTIKHEAIDEDKYSSSKKYLVGIPVYSEKYNLMGKIDIYDQENKFLIERKTKIKNIYDGYKMQLYAQMFCLEEMSFEVKKIFVYSLEDNKKYKIDLPNETERKNFIDLIEKIQNFDILKNKDVKVNENKCLNCIYNELCPFKK